MLTLRASIDDNAPTINAGSSATERAAALNQAIEQATESGKTVLMQF